MQSKRNRPIYAAPLAALLAGAVLFGAAGQLSAGPGRGGNDPEKMLQRMKQHLDLSDEQVEQIRGIQNKHRPQREQKAGEMRELRKQLSEIMLSDNASRVEVKALLEKMAGLRVDMRLSWFDQHTEVRAVLNYEQRAKLREFQQKRMERMEKRMEDRRGARDDDDGLDVD